jgi:F-type H+-transporting ATPase subunit c
MNHIMKLRNAWYGLGAVIAGFGFSGLALAQEGAAAASGGDGIGKLGAALAISIAAVGGAMAQGKTASAALEGIARNPAAQPKIFTPMIIGLALIESLVLYAFVIALVKY